MLFLLLFVVVFIFSCWYVCNYFHFQEINVGSITILEEYVNNYVSWCKKHWTTLYEHEQQQSQQKTNQEDQAKKWVKFRSKMTNAEELGDIIRRSHKGFVAFIFCE